MNYEKQFELLKEEIKELEEGKVKNSLTRIENILDCLHNEFIVQREEKIITRISEHINKKRLEIRKGKAVIELEANAPKLIMHVIPLSAFASEHLNYEIGLDIKNYKTLNLKPLYVNGWNHKIDKDGVYAYLDNYGYSKLYSNGVFESAERGMLSYNSIHIDLIESEILNGLEWYQQTLKNIVPKDKFLISIQLIDVKEFPLYYQNDFGSIVQSTKVYEEKDLFLNPVMLSSINDNITLAMKPMFDELWRTFGLPESKNYKNGERVY